MPELPEVETTRRGIQPHVEGRRVAAVVARETRLRWPVPERLLTELPGRRIETVRRRAKYLLFDADGHHLILHLGMSGRLRVVDRDQPPQPHDHVDIVLEDGHALRLNDTRRFGAVLWWAGDPGLHPLLRHLGPEPLSDAFAPAHLYAASRGRRAPVKAFIMDSRIVVGVGNIYATEALFRAGIHPHRPAGRIGLNRYVVLHNAIRDVLRDAIERGGTTLRDYLGADGSPGFFQLDLHAYGRAGAPCRRCTEPLRRAIIGQRATVYCPRCQR